MFEHIRRSLSFTANLGAQPRERLRVENAAGDEAAIYIYDEIGFWGTTASDFQRELAAITAKRINLHINSPGGDVFDGIAIYNLLRDHPANITAYIDGIAASAASFIACAANRIVIAESAFMMIHNAMGFAFGYAADLRRQADILDKISDTIAEIYTGRAGGTRQQWIDAMDAETWYSAAEAVTAHLADEVAGEASVENRTRFNLAEYGYRNTPADLLVQRITARQQPAPTVPNQVNDQPAGPDWRAAARFATEAAALEV